jgi:hypothetical protein
VLEVETTSTRRRGQPDPVQPYVSEQKRTKAWRDKLRRPTGDLPPQVQEKIELGLMPDGEYVGPPLDRSDPLYVALAEATGYTDTDAESIARMVPLVARLHHNGYKPQDVYVAVEQMHASWSQGQITPLAVVNHIGGMLAEAARGPRLGKTGKRVKALIEWGNEGESGRLRDSDGLRPERLPEPGDRDDDRRGLPPGAA